MELYWLFILENQKNECCFYGASLVMILAIVLTESLKPEKIKEIAIENTQSDIKQI